jgi:DNA-binding CsgD family transcriptional regulator
MATSQRAPITDETFQCPVCGASEANGGCTEVGKCITALLDTEKELTRETVAALGNESMGSNARVLEAGFEALSLLHIGLVLCAADGRVIGANEIAEEIFSERDGLEVTHDGIIRASQEGERPLQQLVQQVGSRTRDGGPVSEVLALQRKRKRPLTLLIRASRTIVASEAEHNVLIMVMDSALPVRAIQSELRQLYGFSSMEARLAMLLIQGREFEESCQELAIRRSTGCTHLKRLFKKAGVHRQSELVTLLLKSIGLAYLGGLSAKLASGESSPADNSAVQPVGRPPSTF